MREQLAQHEGREPRIQRRLFRAGSGGSGSAAGGALEELRGAHGVDFGCYIEYDLGAYFAPNWLEVLGI